MGLPSVILESIEPRRLLAVTVVEHADFVEIVGDSSPDRIAISVRDRQLRVVSDNQTRTVRFPGTKSLRISAGAGDDIIRIDQTRVFGSISIDGGAGDDLISLTSVRLSGSLFAQGGEGNDTLRFERENAHAGGGRDIISLARSTVAGAVRINPGNEDDHVVVRRMNINGKLFIDDRRGQADIAVRDTVVAGKFRITADDKADAVSVRDSIVCGTSLIATKGGDDSIRIVGSEFRRATELDAGKGRNSVYREVINKTDFSHGLGAWKTYAADYPAGWYVANYGTGRKIIAEEHYQLSEQIEPSDQINKPWLKLSGINYSDDLMLFVGRELSASEGLKPNTDYNVTVGVHFWKTPNGLTNRLFAGAFANSIIVRRYPRTMREVRLMGEDGKNRAEYGKELARISLLRPDENDPDAINPKPLKGVRVLEHPLKAKTDSEGKLSIVVGIDGTYETLLQAFFEKIVIVVRPV